MFKPPVKLAASKAKESCSCSPKQEASNHFNKCRLNFTAELRLTTAIRYIQRLML